MMPWSPVVFERKKGNLRAAVKLIVALACATSHTSPPRSVQTAAVSAPVDMMMTRRHTVPSPPSRAQNPPSSKTPPAHRSIVNHNEGREDGRCMTSSWSGPITSKTPATKEYVISSN